MFTKIWDLENFDNETTALWKKMKKLHYEKNLNSPNSSNMARGTLILKDSDIVSYPCSNYRPSNLLFSFNNSCKVLDIKSFWKSMKLWELLRSVMKSGGLL